MSKVAILAAAPPLSQNELDFFLSLVSEEKRERIKKFRFMRDAQNCLLGDVLARSEICRATGLCNRQLEFATNEYGKPYIANDPNIHHNVSHSGNYVACAISDRPIGIDIELLRPIDLKIAERFFAPDETAYIAKSDQVCRFYEIWTKKESRVKCEGEGLRKPLPSFSVLDEEDAFFYHKVCDNGEAICHVCSKERDIPSVVTINADMLLEQICEN